VQKAITDNHGYNKRREKMIELGGLSGGQKQIDTAFGITPKQIEKEKQLLNITNSLYYKGYEAELSIHSGGFPEMSLKLNGDTKNEKDKAFVRKCYELLKPLVDELNSTTRTELKAKRKEIINSIK
jgi:hypothetical protein